MIRIGIRVKDVVSGFEGIVMSRTVFLHGCTRYGVAPTKLTDDGKPGDTMHFDDVRMAVVDETQVLPDVALPEGLPSLGSTAKDTLSGYKGMVVGYSVYAGGQTYIGLQAPTLEKGEPAKEQWMDFTRVELVQTGTPPVSPNNSATTGGPEGNFEKSYERV